ncbi:hypothetical protein BGW80DRAFT_1276611 [Lactifluus volemus]|nr:hypothetical protein BGW80DRAFT_1276611 [Lactifluus volemus]
MTVTCAQRQRSTMQQQSHDSLLPWAIILFTAAFYGGCTSQACILLEVAIQYIMICGTCPCNFSWPWTRCSCHSTFWGKANRD